MRRVVTWGLLGALPGVLIITSALVLHSLDLITSDQSQYAFSGVPILFVGVIVGLVAGAASSGITGGVLIGMGLGFIAGVLVSFALAGVLIDVPFFLFVTPGGMLAGGFIGAWWADRRT